MEALRYVFFFHKGLGPKSFSPACTSETKCSRPPNSHTFRVARASLGSEFSRYVNVGLLVGLIAWFILVAIPL